MRTLTSPRVLSQFVERFHQLSPDDPARWGSMSAQQMVHHIADATGAVLQFGSEVDRAAELLEELAGAPPAAYSTSHPVFGRMTRQDWLRWAYLHTDHHLRQFGR